MTSGRLLARNSVLNLVGQVGPLIIAVFAVPVLVRGLGLDRFGVLTLAWTAIGYFSLFDLGLGRALTQSVSAAIGADKLHELPTIAVTALAIMLGLGVVGGLLFAVATPFLVDRALHIPAPLRPETITSFYLLCASLPFVLLTAGLRSLFEAHQEFGMATALRVPFAMFNFVAPLAVLPFSHSLVPVVGILVIGRAATCAAHWVAARRRYGFLRLGAPIDRAVLRPLLSTGGWMTVSNVISPLMVNFDRFVVGGLLSVTAVAYYATPYDMVMKLLLVPSALIGVLFPAFAAIYQRDRFATARLLDRTVRVMLLAIFPPVLVLVAFAHEGMQLWLGADFAAHSAAVVQWLAAGVLVNSIAWVAFAVVQGVGRSDLTAKLHLVELPIYAALLFVLTKTLGIPGVALAWAIRATIDTAALVVLTVRALPEARADLARSARIFIVLLSVLAAAATIHSVTGRLWLTFIAIAAFGLGGWRHLLHADERQAILRLIPRAT